MSLSSLNRSELHTAAFGTDADRVRTLIADGADPNERDAQHLTPLQLTQSGPVADALLQGGADTDVLDSLGRTPLHNAACDPMFVGNDNANRELTQVLIASGADLNSRDQDGRTPLHLTNDPETVRMLGNAGADLDAKDTYGLSVSQCRNDETGAVFNKVRGVLNAVDQARAERPDAEKPADSLDAIYAAMDAPPAPVEPRAARTRPHV